MSGEIIDNQTLEALRKAKAGAHEPQGCEGAELGWSGMVEITRKPCGCISAEFFSLQGTPETEIREGLSAWAAVLRELADSFEVLVTELDG